MFHKRIAKSDTYSALKVKFHLRGLKITGLAFLFLVSVVSLAISADDTSKASGNRRVLPPARPRVVISYFRPDLTSTDIKFYHPQSQEIPENEVIPVAGELVTCKAILKNQGDKSTGVFNVKWFVDGVQKGYGSHSGLPSQATSNGNVRFDWVPTVGNHTLLFVADCDNHIPESNENNNSFSKTLTILEKGTVIGPGGGEVLSSDGKLKLIIPNGALSNNEEIIIKAIPGSNLGNVPLGTTLLSAAECKPYGLVFNKPIQLIYTLSQAEVPGTFIELGLYDSIQAKIIPTGQVSKVPADGYHVSFNITSFFNSQSLTSKQLKLASLSAASGNSSAYAALKSSASQGAPIGGGVKIPLPDMFTGSFSHAIPITVAPGRKGMQPAVALTYRSSNPNSWTGIGFSLNSGYIVRSTRLGPPSYNDTQDTFYFVTDAGTTELVNLTDNLYQAKVESSFTKFYKESDDSWRVIGKDGSVLRLGQASESKESSNKGTFSWCLTRATDTNGNYMSYTYIKDQGKAYLARIDYTGNDNGVSPTNTVEFFLESRDDIVSNYISSAKVSTAKRLKEIQVKVRGNLVWRYELEYIYSTDTNRSILKSITQKGSDDKSLPKQIFSYQSAK